MNGSLERAIQEANEALGDEGWHNADFETKMLVSLDYLVREVRGSRRFHIRFDGKAWLSGMVLLGGLLGAMIRTLL